MEEKVIDKIQSLEKLIVKIDHIWEDLATILDDVEANLTELKKTLNTRR